MSRVWFTSDLHFGHKGVHNFRKQFSSDVEHNEVLVDNICSKLHKRDTLWILGDICFTYDSLRYLEQIARCCAVLRLVPGNHDIDNRHYAHIAQHIMAFTVYKGAWISHCPIHPQEMRNRYANVHGHLHSKVIDDPRYYNVCPEHHDFHPIQFLDIKEYVMDRIATMHTIGHP